MNDLYNLLGTLDAQVSKIASVKYPKGQYLILIGNLGFFLIAKSIQPIPCQIGLFF